VRVVLDACVPRKFGRLLRPHQLTTVHALGFGDLDDRPLLDALEGECEALVTVDRRMSEQQQLVSRSYALIVIRAPSNRLEDLAPFAAETLNVLESVQAGDVRVVGG
jgi:predicted nuclease of predicted toxin-antitoxin system